MSYHYGPDHEDEGIWLAVVIVAVIVIALFSGDQSWISN